MIWYAVTFSLRGPTGTPWQADTIFGHLCWVLRHRRGEPALKEFLEPFLAGKPTFLLSDGFPTDVLPRPLTFGAPYAPSREGLRQGREVRKQALISREDFLRALRGEAFMPHPLQKDEIRPTSRVSLKNQISRLTGTTGQEGQLFTFVEYWMPRVVIYLKIQEGYEGKVEELFRWLAEAGYGKRKAVGYGAISHYDFQPFEGFPVLQEANAFVSLSPFVPAASDPSDGRWRIMVKFGRLGEEFALSDNPFKRPLLMLTAGSVFWDKPVREWYGCMVAGVSPAHPEVVHYGYALPVPMQLPPEADVEKERKS